MGCNWIPLLSTEMYQRHNSPLDAGLQQVRKLRHQRSTHFTGLKSSIRRHRNDKFSFLCGAIAQLSSKLAPLILILVTGCRWFVSFRPHYYRGTTPRTHSTGVWVSPVPVWTFGEKSLLLLAAFEPRTDCTTQAATAWQGVSLTLMFHCYWP